MEDGDSLLGLSDDLDVDSSRRPAGRSLRPSRFQPKLKGKIKSEPSTDPATRPPPIPIAAKKKEEEDIAMVEAGQLPQEPSSSLPGAANDAEEPESSPMEVDDGGEDVVVREIDVFFTPAPLDEDCWLYVMQYPLRPSWRPYELNERCEEVRVKPKQSKVEVDLNMDIQSENYDPDVTEHLMLQKQTLSSSKATFVTDYAVGIMIGNQLHLNPVHAVVQLRPSMIHVGGVQKRKHSGHNQEVTNRSNEENVEESLKSSSRQRGKQVPEDPKENIDDAEPWVSLEYHAADSLLSASYQQKMVAEEKNHIQFTMTPSDFLNSLCPGTSTDNKIVKSPSRREFYPMPLEERLKKWLCEASQVNRFIALMYLARTNSSEEVLNVLQRHAVLVQGLWVSKSSLLYEGREARVRDYILLLFSKSRVISKDKLKALRISDDILKKILWPLAKERPVLNDWKFREDTDISFEKEYPHIVEEQRSSWSSRERDIMDSLRAPMIKNSINPNMAKRVTFSGKVDPGANRGKDGTVNPASTTMSNEAREALPKALLKLFHVQKARSLNSITRGLREMALKKSSSWKEDQETKTFVNAANGAASAPPELKSVISQLAVNIHGVYVLKSVGNPLLDSLRNVVIKLFLEREPNAKLEKQEIERAAKVSLKRDISDPEYNQVVNDLCVNSKGGWMLKSGD